MPMRRQAAMRHRLLRHRGFGKQRSDDACFASVVYFNMLQETRARGIHNSINSALTSHALYRKASVHMLMLWRCASEAGDDVWQRIRASKQHACVLQSCATRRALDISSLQCLRTQAPRRHRVLHKHGLGRQRRDTACCANSFCLIMPQGLRAQ